MKRLILNIIRKKRSVGGVFWTNSNPEKTAFDGRVVLEIDSPVSVSVNVGNATKVFSSSDLTDGLPIVDGLPEEKATLDFGDEGSERYSFSDNSFVFESFLDNKWAERNEFRSAKYDNAEIPSPEEWNTETPRPVWDGHNDELDCYARAFQIVGSKIRKPVPESGFSRNFVYTEFADSIFIWGNCFITMFGKYAENIFPFIHMLDNFYGRQDRGGFISRQIGIDNGRSRFERNDPCSSGGNIFAWAEWEHFRVFRDRDRLHKVFAPLLAYHQWTKEKRTWQNGTYFSSGWGCGMDNITRIDAAKYSPQFDHGHLSFIDITLQQIFNAKIILRIAAEIGEENSDLDELREEISSLTKFVNERMWDEKAGVYKDLNRDGSLNQTMHIGTFWAFLAGVVPPERMDRLIANLENPSVFAVPCGTASTAVCDSGFVPNGGEYWRGGVWCITDYMVVRGLMECGRYDAAHRLAMRHVGAVARVFRDTHSIWESYDPVKIAPGSNEGAFVRKEFVGFSGVTPIAMFIEAVLGINVDADGIVWNVRLTERHGIENLSIGGNRISLICAARSSDTERPEIRIEAENPVRLTVKWSGGEYIRD